MAVQYQKPAQEKGTLVPPSRLLRGLQTCIDPSKFEPFPFCWSVAQWESTPFTRAGS